MSSTKNIGGSASDKYHRYQMPELQLKVEKPGTNGQRTVVLNIDLVCKSLKVPPEWLSKFWGYELAGQSQFTQTEHGGRTACTIMGNHSRVQVEKVLEKFIQLYVLCPTCKLPETRISVKSKGAKVKCASCGYVAPLKTGHRLDNFILKNPAKKIKDLVGEGGEEGKEVKEAEPKKKKKKDKSEEKEKEKPGADAGDAPEPDSVEGEKWSVDTSEKAQEQRRKEFEAESNKEKVEKAVVKESKQPEDILRILFGRVKDQPDHVVSVTSELNRLSLVHTFTPHDRARILLSAVIDVSSAKTLAAQFTKQAPVFKKAIPHLKEQSTGLLFIGSILRLLAQSNDALLRIPMILKACHEESVLDESTIFAWAASPPDSDNWAVDRPTAVLARQKSAVFVEWLKSANEEEGEEE